MRVFSVNRARMFVLLFVLGCNLGVAFPLAAASPHPCRVSAAAAYRATADRYRAHDDFPDAAVWYEAAARATEGCASASGAMLGARSLVQAGAAVAQSGDYLHALALARQAHTRLHDIAAGNRREAALAHTYLGIVDDLISAINTIAQSSM